MTNIILAAEIASWLKELEEHKESMSESRYNWMKGLFREVPVDIEKARTVSGYLMALRDCGRDIGDLKLILESILCKINK